jgi:NAD(P)H dehydrogenase (quinone)
MATKVQIVFYSMYGHVYQLAQAIAEGARGVEGVEATLARVPETLPDEILAKMGALDAKGQFAGIPTADPQMLADADAILLGTPTRFGLVCAQMQSFLDATGSLWARGALIGKLGGAFTSTATQHGGQETTIVHLHTFFYHQGMVVAGVPYSTPELSNLSEISGGSPYGASTIAGSRGERQPTAAELAIARAQGTHAARIAARLGAR